MKMGKKSTRASPYSSSWNDYRKRVLIFFFSWLVFRNGIEGLRQSIVSIVGSLYRLGESRRKPHHLSRVILLVFADLFQKPAGIYTPTEVYVCRMRLVLLC